MNKQTLFKSIPIMLLCWSCLQIGEFIDPDNIDVSPPVFSKMEMDTPTQISLEFNEDVFLAADITVPEHLMPVNQQSEENKVVVELSSPADPGEEFWISGFVRDSHGNETSFVFPAFGYNNRIPPMIINECTPQGSSSHPDFVEIRILGDGNIGGVCLYEGIPDEYSDRFILPECEVTTGEYLLIHCKPKGIPEEINETSDISVSGGLDAFDFARDFWVEGGDGLSGNNGVISLFSSPGGDCIDALIYSNRTSSSDTKYRGFGSTKTMNLADYIASIGQWNYKDEQIAPEDTVNPDDSTATRSISRMHIYTDINESSDWHITPSGGYTPGRDNCDDIYM